MKGSYRVSAVTSGKPHLESGSLKEHRNPETKKIERINKEKVERERGSEKKEVESTLLEDEERITQPRIKKKGKGIKKKKKMESCTMGVST